MIILVMRHQDRTAGAGFTTDYYCVTVVVFLRKADNSSYTQG